MENNFLKGILLLVGAGIATYAIRSYGYQKECSGYMKGAMVTAEAYEKLNKEKHND